MLTSTISIVQFKTRRHQGRRLPILLRFALVFLHRSKLSADDRWDQLGKHPSVTLGYALLNYRFATAVNLQFGLAKLSYLRSLLASSYKLLHVDPVAIPDLASHFYKYFAPHLVLHGRRADGLLADHLTLTDDLQTGDSDRGFSPEASTSIFKPMPSNYRPISVTTASEKTSAKSPTKSARPSCNYKTISVFN